MTWLPKDEGTWGIILAIAALVLAFPLTVIGNLVTPKIRNWWAKRSVSTLEARIAKLKAELSKMDGVVPFSREHAFLLKWFTSFLQSILILTLCLIGSVIGLGGYGESTIILVFSLCGVIITFIANLEITTGLRPYLNTRSPEHRDGIEEGIKELTNKLHSLQKS